MDDPARFFPGVHEPVMDRLDTLTLEREVHQVSAVAQRAAELLSSELAQGKPMQRTGIRRFLLPVDKAVGKFVTSVGLIRAIEFLERVVIA